MEYLKFEEAQKFVRLLNLKNTEYLPYKKVRDFVRNLKLKR